MKNIILVANTKGGVGKTTVASNLAVLRRNTVGNSFLLIDADKQASISKWVYVRNKNETLSKMTSVQKIGEDIKNSVTALSDKYNDIIIDSVGADGENLRWSMLVATKIVIPTQPSQLDIWEMSKLDRMIEEVKIVNPNIKAYILPNRMSTNPRVDEMGNMREMAEDLKNMQIMNSFLSERKAFREAARKGASVIELDTRDLSLEKAQLEIHNLYKEVYNEQ